MLMNYFIIMRNCSLCCGFNSLITEITLVLCARDKHRLLIHSANSGMTGIGQDSASAALQKAKTRSSQHLKKRSELLCVSSPWGINECLQQSISQCLSLCRPQEKLPWLCIEAGGFRTNKYLRYLCIFYAWLYCSREGENTGDGVQEMLKSRLWCCYVGFWFPNWELIKCF